MKSPAGALLAVLLICVVLSRVAGHAMVAAVAVATMLLVGLAWPVVVARFVRLGLRTTTLRATAGDAFTMRVTTTSRLPVALPGFELAGPLLPGGVTSLNVIRPGHHTRDQQIIATRRGVFPLASITSSTAFPFGLIHRQARVDSADTLVVWPRPATISPDALNALTRSAAAQRTSSDSSTAGEPAGVRPYRRGDSVRHIHWQQTARYDRLMVRERSAVQARQCEIHLDTRVDSYDGSESHFDKAVETVAGMLVEAVSQKIHARLQFDSTILTVTNEPTFESAMNALAALILRPPGAEALSPPSNRNQSGLFVTTLVGATRLPHLSMSAVIVASPMEAP